MTKKELCDYLEGFKDDIEIVFNHDGCDFGPFSYKMSYRPGDKQIQMKESVLIFKTGTVISG